jgi:hypothetical protein
MDHEVDIVRELDPDDLQQVPDVVGSDGEDLGWVGIGCEVDDGDGVVERVKDGVVVDAVLVGRTMDVHTCIS